MAERNERRPDSNERKQLLWWRWSLVLRPEHGGRSSSGKFAIVAVNRNSSPANVDFSISGFPSVTSVTPTLTSASANLVDQADVNVSNDAFAYSLPATSVVTFHETASSSSSKAPAAPTNLTVSVH
jgi:hypothetical protein